MASKRISDYIRLYYPVKGIARIWFTKERFFTCLNCSIDIDIYKNSMVKKSTRRKDIEKRTYYYCLKCAKELCLI